METRKETCKDRFCPSMGVTGFMLLLGGSLVGCGAIVLAATNEPEQAKLAGIMSGVQLGLGLFACAASRRHQAQLQRQSESLIQNQDVENPAPASRP